MEELKNEVIEIAHGTEEAYKSGSVQFMDSREVAQIVEKEHKHLLRDIKKYSEELTKSNIGLSDFFIESSYSVDGQSRKYPCYLVTKKGCEFIAHKLTGIKGTKFTAKYLEKMGGNQVKLKEINEKQEQTITTLEVAEMLGIEHWKVLRKLAGQEKNGKHIKGYIEILTDNEIVVTDYFIPSTYQDISGKINRCYKVTKLGCDFLANKFTGEKGVLFTAKYVKRFHEMEDTLKSGELVQIQELTKQLVEVRELVQDLLCGEKKEVSKITKNPYGNSKNIQIEERKKELYSLTARVAGLCKMSQTKILHYMYRTLEEDLRVVLDAYKSVYSSETGKTDVCMVEVIAANDQLYASAVEMNQAVIERKQIYG